MTRKVWLFLILSFGLSAIFFSTFNMFGPVWSFIALLLGMIMPALSVVIVQKLYKLPMKGRFYLKLRFNKFVVLGVLMPIMLVFYTLILNVLFTGAKFGIAQIYIDQLAETGVPESYYLPIIIGQTLIMGILAGITINAVFAFGEELGWRGFLQKEFEYMGPWKSSAIIGAIWGLWHTPLIVQGYNFPDHPYIGVLFMIVASSFLGIIISYFTKRSGTIMTAAFFHGVFNAVASITIILTDGYVDIYHGPFGLTAIITYASVAGLLFLFERRVVRKSNELSGGKPLY